MGVKSYISFILELYKLEFLAAIEYRLNFILQTIFMFLNDLFWIIFWHILFQRFGTIKGYTYDQLLLLWAVTTISFALAHIFFENHTKIARMIEEGKLDYYLTMPKNELAHIIIKTDYAAFGDLLFGIVLAIWSVSLQQLPLYLLLVLISTLIFLSWGILTQSITFFVSRFQRAARSAKDIFLTVTLYPFSVYEGFTRFFLLFIMPAGFVGGIPVELLTNFTWKWLIISLVFATLFFTFTVWVFYKGLKRYESGNVIAMKG